MMLPRGPSISWAQSRQILTLLIHEPPLWDLTHPLSLPPAPPQGQACSQLAAPERKTRAHPQLPGHCCEVLPGSPQLHRDCRTSFASNHLTAGVPGAQAQGCEHWDWSQRDLNSNSASSHLTSWAAVSSFENENPQTFLKGGPFAQFPSSLG